MLHELDEGAVTGNISLGFLLQLPNFTQCYRVRGQAILFAIIDFVRCKLINQGENAASNLTALLLWLKISYRIEFEVCSTETWQNGGQQNHLARGFPFRNEQETHHYTFT